MHHFDYRDGQLYCENVALSQIAQAVGTPVYIYSTATMTRHYNVMADAFSGLDYLIAYSVKANGNLGVIATLAKEGAGADVVSGGELMRAIKAGISPEDIVFSGVGKTESELEIALGLGIGQFNIESAAEIDAISQIATKMHKTAPCALRVNPDIAAGGHENISTGKANDKFGIAWKDASGLYEKINQMPGLKPVGLDVHIGSQITALAPFEAALHKLLELADVLRQHGHNIERLDLGGGLGIPYTIEDTPPSPAEYANMIKRVMCNSPYKLIIEPGRLIMGNAGVMLSKITYIKPSQVNSFLILDAGMNDLVRPAIYQAHHDIIPVHNVSSEESMMHYDIVGPVCESTDKFALGRRLPKLSQGDLVAFMSAGAYGAVMSSQYNARALCPEVLVKDDQYEIIRQRPNFDQMIELEHIPDWL